MSESIISVRAAVPEPLVDPAGCRLHVARLKDEFLDSFRGLSLPRYDTALTLAIHLMYHTIYLYICFCPSLHDYIRCEAM